MLNRHFTLGLAAVSLLVFSLAWFPPLRVPQHAAGVATAFQEQRKVTLGETSIDGPSLWTNNPGPGEPSAAPAAVLGWTGTDDFHQLNLMTSSDGVTFGDKLTLDELSISRPAVAVVGGGKIALAWTGTDSNHALNILVDPYATTPRKLTLWTDNSFTSPALAYQNGSLWLSWTGTDENHSLNILPIALDGSPHAGQKLILPYSSVNAPSLTVVPGTNQLRLSWSMSTPTEQIQFAVSQDGIHWQTPSTTPLDETTAAAPALLGVAYGGLPSDVLSWTGTDNAHSLNVRYTQSYPQWPLDNAKSILPETAMGAPALGHLGGNNTMLVAWTGTDPEHHLNVADLTLNLPAACIPAQGVSPVSATPITTGSPSAKRVSLTFDSDGGSVGNATTYLDILKSEQVHVTFFLTGQFAQANPDLVRRIVAEGHDIGNHTQDHADLATPTRSDAFICSELTSAEAAIGASAGRTTRPYFRPPYGSYNAQVADLAGGLGYRTILWSIDPRDWDPSVSAQNIITTVLSNANLRSGAIILMHVNSANEPKALDSVIKGLKQDGFTIVPLSQLLQ